MANNSQLVLEELRDLYIIAQDRIKSERIRRVVAQLEGEALKRRTAELTGEEKLNNKADGFVRYILNEVRQEISGHGVNESYVDIMESDGYEINPEFEASEVIPLIIRKLEAMGLTATSSRHQFSEAHQPYPSCCMKFRISGWLSSAQN